MKTEASEELSRASTSPAAAPAAANPPKYDSSFNQAESIVRNLASADRVSVIEVDQAMEELEK